MISLQIAKIPAHKNNVIVDVRVADTGMVCVAHKTILQQFISLLGTLGGAFAMVSTVFFLVFAKKYPRIESEVLSSELTLNLRRYKASRRPSYDNIGNVEPLLG